MEKCNFITLQNTGTFYTASPIEIKIQKNIASKFSFFFSDEQLYKHEKYYPTTGLPKVWNAWPCKKWSSNIREPNVNEVTSYLFERCWSYPPLEACAGNLVQICPRLVTHDKVPTRGEYSKKDSKFYCLHWKWNIQNFNYVVKDQS